MSEREKRYSGPILVTGGAGFIGSHLIERFSKEHQNPIVSLDNYSTGTPENHIEAENVRYLEGHTKDVEKVWADIDLPDPSIIFHLGEFARINSSFSSIQEMWESNMVGSFNVIDWASRNGAFVVYAGSSSAFGNKGEDANCSPYAFAKSTVAQYIRNMSKKWYPHTEGDVRQRLDYAIAYFYNVYGPRHIREGKGATVIGIWEEQYLEGKLLVVFEPGTQTRDFTHVEDVVEGVVRVADEGSGDNYQLGYGKQRKIIDVARMFGREIKMLPARKGDRESGEAPSSRATDELGWKAEIDIEDYINDFVKMHEKKSTTVTVYNGT